MNLTSASSARESKNSPVMPPDIPIVFVVDDDISVRDSLELLIQTAGWRPIVFASALEFLSHPRKLAPSCLILDVTMPGLSGFELQQVVADRVDMPIIFISGHGDIPMSVRAIKAGAVEFLSKPFDDEILLTAISDAIDRSNAALDQVLEMQSLQRRYACLSPREKQVMDLVVAGRLNKQVGGELGISEITVKAHRGKMMRKMKVHTLADLVNLAARLRTGSSGG